MDESLQKLVNWSGSNKNLLNRLEANLRKVRHPDKIILAAHNQAFSEINCLKCANCCRTTGPMLTGNDISRIATQLGTTEKKFVEQYLRKDEDGDFVFKQMPCPFLGADNYCTIYAYRPKACRDYPHTDQRGQLDILHLTRKNARICPAVSRIFQLLNAELGG